MLFNFVDKPDILLNLLRSMAPAGSFSLLYSTVPACSYKPISGYLPHPTFTLIHLIWQKFQKYFLNYGIGLFQQILPHNGYYSNGLLILTTVSAFKGLFHQGHTHNYNNWWHLKGYSISNLLIFRTIGDYMTVFCGPCVKTKQMLKDHCTAQLLSI